MVLTLFTLGGLTGVVLSNASIDIAVHDMFFIEFTSTVALMVPAIEKFDVSKKIDDVYIKMFWVGLMDGDGSIQVNQWRKKSLQYRLVIKLSNTPSNYDMLIKIAKVIGGSVMITGNSEDVIWVVNRKEKVQEIIKIFDTYPLLTSSKICQLDFLKKCILENSVDSYLTNRNSKYIKQAETIKSASALLQYDFETKILGLPYYFKGWLSGFIEAEGCFSTRKKSNNQSFSIGQNDDLYLINKIKEFFEATNKVRKVNGKFYSLEIYKKETLKKIISHCNYYPLLGEKAVSLKKFNQIIQQK